MRKPPTGDACRAALGAVHAVWQESLTFGEALFGALEQRTSAALGIERPAYGAGEQVAHDLVTQAGREIGLEIEVDAAGNLHLTLPGADRSAPRWLTGSHLDAVPAGGNFDGAAGVVAGLTVLHAIRRAGLRPRHGIEVVAFRAEEGSSWFGGPHKSHFGSRSLLGQLSHQEMTGATSLVDGRTLHEAIRQAGFRPDAIDLGRRHLDLERIAGFVELHIEQGPVLVERAVPVGIVTGIRGTLRGRNCRVVGSYSHSGAVPREYRQDAVFAAVEFAHVLERRWEQWLADGRDVVCTLGRFGTDPERHGLTKVPGELRFTVDIRSQEAALLAEAETFVRSAARDVERRRGVVFDLGNLDRAAPAAMDETLVRWLTATAEDLHIPALRLASGAGHDAANFAHAGVPTAMIFVRNNHGSHNPDEAMDFADFALAGRLLAGLLAGAADGFN